MPPLQGWREFFIFFQSYPLVEVFRPAHARMGWAGGWGQPPLPSFSLRPSWPRRSGALQKVGTWGGKSGRSWIRTSEGVSQQIYSLPRLAASVSARKGLSIAKKVGAVKTVPEGEDCLGGEGKVDFGILRC